MKKTDIYYIFCGLVIIILCFELSIQLSPFYLGYDRIITRIYDTEDEKHALEVAETFDFSQLLNTSHTYAPPLRILDNITINNFDASGSNTPLVRRAYLNYTVISIAMQSITLIVSNRSDISSDTDITQYFSKNLIITGDNSNILVNRSFIHLASILNIEEAREFYSWRFFIYNSSLKDFTFINQELFYTLNGGCYFIEMHLRVHVWPYYNTLAQFLIIDKTFQPVAIIIENSDCAVV